MADVAPTHAALPQSQPHSAPGMTKAAADGGGKTRVLLRVKRRRPPPSAAAADAASATGPGGRADDPVGPAPDRIQLALPSTPAEGSNKKRRRLDKREELALIERLDSAVSLRNGSGNGRAKNDAGAEGDAPCTPPRKGAGNNPYDPDNNMDATDPNNDMLGRPGTPPRPATPPSMASQRSTDNNSDDTTPAPPTKPKRTVIFRKITDLQRRLDEDDDDPAEDQPSAEKEGSSGALSALGATPPRAKWTSKDEARSKWLRVVDVMLKEDEDQVSSIGSSANDSTRNSVLEGESLGGGARVRRMRPRPSDRGDGDEGEGNGGGARKKRRKVGWVVEQSRTVLESDFWGRGAAKAGSADGANSNLDKLYLAADRLLEFSLEALHDQGGGSVFPHLSVVQNDPRIGYVGNTPSGRRMVNHARGTSGPSHPKSNHVDEGRGRTVLHYAALWGDLAGVQTALEMGADPTIFDAQGNTPVGLARRGDHPEVVAALVEAEKQTCEGKNIKESNSESEYYYEVYCLEDASDDTREAASTGGVDAFMEEKKDDRPRFLRPKDHSTTTGDSIPDLERSSVLSEEDDDSSRNRRGCALIELQKGFGYWNERGELVLEAASQGRKHVNTTDEKAAGDDDDRFVRRFYNENVDDDSMGEDEHDSNDEGYDGNDYPDDESLGLDSDYEDYRDADAYSQGGGGSDDDSVDNWKTMDFRKRLVADYDAADYDLKDWGYGG